MLPNQKNTELLYSIVLYEITEMRATNSRSRLLDIWDKSKGLRQLKITLNP